MKENLLRIKEEILKKLEEVKDGQKLKELEDKYFSRKSELNLTLKKIKDLSLEAKKEIGLLANSIKKDLQEKLNEIKKRTNDSTASSEIIDPSLPGKNRARPSSSQHSIFRGNRGSFTSLGFLILDGPELESDYYNFTALNFSEHHPLENA